MIPLLKETPDLEYWGIERCYFKCGNTTRHWHWRTNQPICKDCAKTRKVSEIEKCTPTYKVPTKAEYIKSL
tara:strand:+ start:31 stop:243 length:213 start_codon:yes stop_codon:yes gene_type:complete